eukprot:CAMPEP_0175295120 /NCGR_PEP_ID=MMETSP0093-20121207/58351_1 /TAXON_ID=311494 /ORGANISM="Alexandrium monilatum, Strain CCMP3105" /LENGTH=33 /DNA_ID= /DNA_START= /DNA_END= /DNA_ORIENTATION=
MTHLPMSERQQCPSCTTQERAAMQAAAEAAGRR